MPLMTNKFIRYAVNTKRIHKHFAPSGFVTSFEVVTDEINYFGTPHEAEKFIDEQTDVYQDRFWTLELIYVPKPIVSK